MKCERTHFSRQIPYDDAKLKFDGRAALKVQIIKFIGGIRAPRKGDVTRKQLEQWFRTTDKKFLDQVLTDLLDEGRVKLGPKSLGSSRKYNGSYVYRLTDTDTQAEA